MTFIPLPIVSPLGGVCNLAASINSFLPSNNPALCGPRRPLPPEKATMSNPILVNLNRLSTGGTSAAQSIKVGMLCFFPRLTNSSHLMSPLSVLAFKNHNIAVFSLIAFSSSSAVFTLTSLAPTLVNACA